MLIYREENFFSGCIFENNNKLCEILVASCQFGAECACRFSLALRGCNKPLTSVAFASNQLGDEQLVEVIEALCMHPQIEKLRLTDVAIGRNECAALANLLCETSIDPETLDLHNNSIDDEGVDVLVGALPNSRLSALHLSSNPNITERGYQRLASLLENPNSNLEHLHLFDNHVGDEGALIFANALATNRKLKELELWLAGITAKGWSSFPKVLCDTSSINTTFLSNHTLECLSHNTTGMPSDVVSLLALNRSSEDKKEVAIKKIVKHHNQFDMQPFFEWDLKVLPLAVSWFERARSVVNDEAGIGKRKLSVIYQFIRAMPEVYEPAQ